MKAWLLVLHDDDTRRLIELDQVTSVTARAEAPDEDSIDAFGRLASIGNYDPTPLEHDHLVPEINWRRIPAKAPNELQADQR